MSAITMSASYKHQVASSFGQAGLTYDAEAMVQKYCAEKLLRILMDLDIPDGVILEIGCGTGFVTQGLIHSFPTHELEITDISVEMLEVCQKNLAPLLRKNLSFRQLDAEKLDPNDNRYSLIISNFVIQWFEDPIKGIHTLSRCLKPGGILLVSFPNQDSFPEWKTMCRNLHLTFTGNPLPDAKKLISYLTESKIDYRYQEQIILTHYKQSLSFFRSIKRIGAGLNYSKKTLSPAEFRQLIYQWDHLTQNQIQIQYHVSFLIIYS